MNLGKDHGENQTATESHSRVFNNQMRPRAVVMHCRSGSHILPYYAGCVEQFTNPADGGLPWRVCLNKGCLHLVHEHYTNWLGPVSNDRRAML